MSHACGSSRRVPVPKTRRVPSCPSSRRKTAATTSPTRIVGAACMNAWETRSTAPQKMVANMTLPSLRYESRRNQRGSASASRASRSAIAFPVFFNSLGRARPPPGWKGWPGSPRPAPPTGRSPRSRASRACHYPRRSRGASWRCPARCAGSDRRTTRRTVPRRPRGQSDRSTHVDDGRHPETSSVCARG